MHKSSTHDDSYIFGSLFCQVKRFTFFKKKQSLHLGTKNVQIFLVVEFTLDSSGSSIRQSTEVQFFRIKRFVNSLIFTEVQFCRTRGVHFFNKKKLTFRFCHEVQIFLFRSSNYYNRKPSSLFEPPKFTLFPVHLENVIKNWKFSSNMMETSIYFQEFTSDLRVRKKEVHERWKKEVHFGHELCYCHEAQFNCTKDSHIIQGDSFI